MGKPCHYWILNFQIRSKWYKPFSIGYQITCTCPATTAVWFWCFICEAQRNFCKYKESLTGTSLNALFVTYQAPIFYKGAEKLSDNLLKELENAYGFLEAFLGPNKYLVGNQLTVADISCSTTINMLRLVTPIDEKKFPKLKEWMIRVTLEPTYARVDKEGQDNLVKALIQSCKNDKIVPEL